MLVGTGGSVRSCWWILLKEEAEVDERSLWGLRWWEKSSLDRVSGCLSRGEWRGGISLLCLVSTTSEEEDVLCFVPMIDGVKWEKMSLEGRRVLTYKLTVTPTY